MGHYRQNPGVDTDLEQRKAELSQLRAEHVEARARLCRLRAEIVDFETCYDQTLGRRLAFLEELEREINRYGGSSNSEESASEATTSAGDGRQAPWKSGERDIKSLYREVAKAIHPDLAGGGPPAFHRHELMSRANQAYADEDKGTLQDILRNWWQSRAQWDPEWAELVRVRTRIAQERKDLDEVNAGIDALKNSWPYQFKLRLDTGTNGSHLLADMITAVDLSIDRLGARLAALKARHAELSSTNTADGAKALRFPDGFSCGTVYLRERKSLNHTKWMKAGPARGVVRVDDGLGARLDIAAQRGTGLDFLSLLKPDDLQALYLYDACDSHLHDLVHLSGLEELYLSGTGITDAALATISQLTSLRRIYIYQTAISDEGLSQLQRLPALCGVTSSGNRITDEGLTAFRRTRPQVETVSFRWNR